MPPRFKFNRDEIIANALALVEEKGIKGLTARGLGDRLGTSSKPIFGLFKNMAEVESEVKKSAHALYESYISREFSERKYPFHMACGMGYIKFAMDKPNLFRILFMQDQSAEVSALAKREVDAIVDKIQEVSHLSREKAQIFHAEMWLTMHGIATSIVTSFSKWKIEDIEQLLNVQFEGLKYVLKGDKNAGN